MGMDQNNIPENWICPGCGEPLEEQFSLCWNCGMSREGEKDPNFLQSTTAISSENTPPETSAMKPDVIITAIIIMIGAGIGMVVANDALQIVFSLLFLVMLGILAMYLGERTSDTEELQRKKRDWEARPVCPHCLKDNEPLAHFCIECATPLTSHAAIDPMGQIYAQGDTYRKAAGHPHKLIVVIAMWLIFAPTLFTLIRFIAPGSSHVSHHGESPDNQSLLLEFLVLIFSLGFIVLYSAILFKVTANYLKEKDDSENPSPTDHSQPVA
jgi:hypothetical protein